MIRIKYPTVYMAPQKNGERDWNIGRVSEQDATSVTFDGETFEDQQGNTTHKDQIAPSRKKQIFLRLAQRFFGK